jgi:hypothetical protein
MRRLKRRSKYLHWMAVGRRRHPRTRARGLEDDLQGTIALALGSGLRPAEIGRPMCGGGNAPRPAHRGCIRMTVLGAIVRVMRTVPPPPDRPFEPPSMVWLYESDGWKQVEDPIGDREDGDGDQERADAGYCGHDGKQRQPALR